MQKQDKQKNGEGGQEIHEEKSKDKPKSCEVASKRSQSDLINISKLNEAGRESSKKAKGSVRNKKQSRKNKTKSKATVALSGASIGGNKTESASRKDLPNVLPSEGDRLEKGTEINFLPRSPASKPVSESEKAQSSLVNEGTTEAPINLSSNKRSSSGGLGCRMGLLCPMKPTVIVPTNTFPRKNQKLTSNRRSSPARKNRSSVLEHRYLGSVSRLGTLAQCSNQQVLTLEGSCVNTDLTTPPGSACFFYEDPSEGQMNFHCPKSEDADVVTGPTEYSASSLPPAGGGIDGQQVIHGNNEEPSKPAETRDLDEMSTPVPVCGQSNVYKIRPLSVSFEDPFSHPVQESANKVISSTQLVGVGSTEEALDGCRSFDSGNLHQSSLSVDMPSPKNDASNLVPEDQQRMPDLARVTSGEPQQSSSNAFGSEPGITCSSQEHPSTPGQPLSSPPRAVIENLETLDSSFRGQPESATQVFKFAEENKECSANTLRADAEKDSGHKERFKSPTFCLAEERPTSPDFYPTEERSISPASYAEGERPAFYSVGGRPTSPASYISAKRSTSPKSCIAEDEPAYIAEERSNSPSSYCSEKRSISPLFYISEKRPSSPASYIAGEVPISLASYIAEDRPKSPTSYVSEIRPNSSEFCITEDRPRSPAASVAADRSKSPAACVDEERSRSPFCFAEERPPSAAADNTGEDSAFPVETFAKGDTPMSPKEPSSSNVETADHVIQAADGNGQPLSPKSSVSNITGGNPTSLTVSYNKDEDNATSPGETSNFSGENVNTYLKSPNDEENLSTTTTSSSNISRENPALPAGTISSYEDKQSYIETPGFNMKTLSRPSHDKEQLLSATESVNCLSKSYIGSKTHRPTEQIFLTPAAREKLMSSAQISDIGQGEASGDSHLSDEAVETVRGVEKSQSPNKPPLVFEKRVDNATRKPASLVVSAGRAKSVAQIRPQPTSREAFSSGSQSPYNGAKGEAVESLLGPTFLKPTEIYRGWSSMVVQNSEQYPRDTARSGSPTKVGVAAPLTDIRYLKYETLPGKRQSKNEEFLEDMRSQLPDFWVKYTMPEDHHKSKRSHRSRLGGSKHPNDKTQRQVYW